MLGWMKRRVEFAAIKAAQEDIERQINMLRGMDSYEVGTVLASATFSRLFLEKHGAVPQGAFDLSVERDQKKCDFFQLDLNRLIKEKQKLGAYPDAAGVMILLHTVRALNMPEIRILGRVMWGELERGMDYAAEVLPSLFDVYDIPYFDADLQSVRQIPPGLEPARS